LGMASDLLEREMMARYGLLHIQKNL
jgi:hypothetical protein